MNVEQQLIQMKYYIPEFPNDLDAKLMNRIYNREIPKPRIKPFKMAYILMSVFILALAVWLVLLLDTNRKPVIPLYGDPIVITNTGGSSPSLSRIFYKWEIEGSQYSIEDEIKMIVSFGHGYHPNNESEIKMLLNDLKISITADAFENIGESEYIIKDYNSETYFIDEYWINNQRFEHQVTFKIQLKSLERSQGEIKLIFDNYEEGYVTSGNSEPPRIVTKSVYYVVDELGVLLSDIEPYTLYFKSMDRRYDEGFITRSQYIDEVVPNPDDKIIVNLARVQITLQDDSLQSFTLDYVSKQLRFSLNIGKSYQYLYEQFMTAIESDGIENEVYVKEILDLLLDKGLITEAQHNQETIFLLQTISIELKEGIGITRSLAHLYDKFPDYQPPEISYYEIK